METLKLFDTHCHLAGPDLIEKSSELCANAEQAGVGALAIIAADEESLVAGAKLKTKLQAEFPEMAFVYSSGIHPHEAKTFCPEQKKLIAELSHEASCIGETGLDFYYDLSDRDQQEAAFRFQIELSLKTGKGLVIHCRNSAEEILEVLDDVGIGDHANPGVIHCFAEPFDMAQEFLKRGFFLSFSGILSFNNAKELRETASKIPLEKILIETDSPYLAPVPKRGKQNEPAFVSHTFEVMAQLRKEDRSVLMEQLWKNSCKLFNYNG